jgi:toxin ParE1/3/4
MDLLDRFEQQARKLASAPGIGRPREDLRAGLRSLAVGRYTLFYRQVPGGIEVVRVLHGMRNIEVLFAEDED